MTAPGARPAYGAMLRAYLGPQRGRASLLALLMLCDISLDLLGPQIQSRFLDRALEAAPLQELWRLALLALLVAGLVQLLFIASNYLATDLAQVGTNRLREDLLGQVLRLGPSFHNRHTPGELIERIDGDVATLGNFLSRFLLELVGSVLLLGGALILLWRIDQRIGLLLALFALIALGILQRLTGIGRRRWEADRAAQGELFGFLEERMAGTEDLRASGARDYVMRGFFELSRFAARRRVTAAVFGVLTSGSSILLLGLGTTLALALGVWLHAQGQISLGAVYLIYSYSRLLQGPIDAISRQAQDLQQAGAAIERIARLEAERPSVVDPPEPRPLPAGPLEVSIRGLGFAYDKSRPVIEALDLHLPAGASLGLLGRSGSGKTTLTRLIFRLLDPDAGSLQLGGVDLRDASLAELRGRVALVTQDVQLFHASLRDNLSLFDPELPDAKLIADLEAVGLASWLARLPAGLDTRLEPGGGGISAGEAQLLALGRVFLRDPGLVVLDEASSRLDPATEARLQRPLERLLAGRTAILIAHRLSSLRRVDHIAILDAGRLVETGPRRALAEDPGSRFAALLRLAEEHGDQDLERLLDEGEPARSSDAGSIAPDPAEGSAR